jgi:putative Mg2+ transporter-C (MgtC) family protein
VPETELPVQTVLVRLLAASCLTMLIGWEREARAKPAGLKTHMLVGLGSAAFFLIFIEFAMGPLKDAERLSPDPTRLFQGVITGIGFLGAGAIIQGGSGVRGLTTGTGIWIAGAIGLACGAGYYLIAGTVTLFTLIVLIIVGGIERRFMERGTKDEE